MVNKRKKMRDEEQAILRLREQVKFGLPYETGLWKAEILLRKYDEAIEEIKNLRERMEKVETIIEELGASLDSELTKQNELAS